MPFKGFVVVEGLDSMRNYAFTHISIKVFLYILRVEFKQKNNAFKIYSSRQRYIYMPISETPRFTKENQRAYKSDAYPSVCCCCVWVQFYAQKLLK